MKAAGSGAFDNVSLAGAAIFGALSAALAYGSLLLGLNFPIVPYLQFDLGEVAIVLALFIFGPVPAFAASFVEFAALMAAGVNAPIGPVLKLFAVTSTLVGLWLGVRLTVKIARPNVTNMMGLGFAVGTVVRAAVMTVPNYYLIAFLYSVPGMVGPLSGPFALLGVTLTDGNALFLILGFTAAFNILQLLMVSVISYGVLRVPQLSGIKTGGRPPWFVGVIRAAAASPKGSSKPLSGA